jgi:hypothetical protein
MDAACAILAEAALLRTAFARAGGGKGRSSKTYEVNPKLLRI